jgi:peptidoglycan/xylan/chitin deacetylase (PgdA/CDA1 family)
LRRLTLTFDNGPHATGTMQVLAALKALDLTATFFMVGQRVLAPGGQEAAEAVRSHGHAIGNHTMSHGAPLGEGDDPARAVAEIEDAEAALEGLQGVELLFRPNGRGQLGPHLLNAAAVDYLVARRYTVVTWNGVPRDWETPSDSWVDRAMRIITEREWTVLVLHDHHVAAIAHLPRFLDRVLEAAVRVTAEFPCECVPISHGRVQRPIEGIVANGTWK